MQSFQKHKKNEYSKFWLVVYWQIVGSTVNSTQVVVVYLNVDRND